MIKILFKRSEKAFLPEIDAYLNYFNKSTEFRAYDSLTLQDGSDFNEFDVIWEFKGIGGSKKEENKVLVHEYASLSTGGLPKFKNLLKTQLNAKPDLRIFLNSNVKEGFKFKDNIDFCMRDMGIDQSFFSVKNENKEFDYVYVGSICKERGIDRLLEAFNSKPAGKLCLIGNVENVIYNQYKSNKDIIFTGKIPYSDVPEIASKGIYGINFIPDKYPYNIQTSTKLIEYLALGLKVLTTDYKWVRQFEKKNNCTFYKLDWNRLEINSNDFEGFDFKNKFNPQDYLWEKVIERANIKEKLVSIYKSH